MCLKSGCWGFRKEHFFVTPYGFVPIHADVVKNVGERMRHYVGGVLVFAMAVCACGKDETEDTLDVPKEVVQSDLPNNALSVPKGASLPSQRNLYTVWFDGLSQTAKAGELQECDVTVWNAAQTPAVDLRIDVSFTHQSMGHGSYKIPYADPLGEGRFHIGDAVASMPGVWVLKLTLSGAAGDDSVLYKIEVR